MVRTLVLLATSQRLAKLMILTSVSFIRPIVIKTSLRYLFKTYGDVLDIVAHSNVRMRGQAFVSFADKEVAAKAKKEVHKFPLYGKPMQIDFAKTKSDAVVRKLDETDLENHKADRKERKSTFTLAAQADQRELKGLG